jgi:Skp family chaperone for outer membrane proteins
MDFKERSMNRRKQFLAVLSVPALVVAMAWAQATSTPPATMETITAKSSPAADALVAAAKEAAEGQKSLDVIIKDISAQLTAAQKSDQDQIVALKKSLDEKLKADKKYKPLIDQLDVLQTDLNSSQQKFQVMFNQKAGPVQQKVATDNALVQGITPVVRKENGFSPDTVFDVATQTWKAPVKPKVNK